MLASAYYINRYLEKSISSYKNSIIASLEKSIDRIITYESISPSVFRYIEIKNLFITDDTGNCLLKVEKLRVTFSIAKLLFTDKNPLDMIYLENSSITFNADSDISILNMVKEFFTSRENKSNYTIDNTESLVLTGRNIRISGLSRYGNYTLNKLFLDFSVKNQKAEFMLKTDFSAEKIPVRLAGAKISSKVRAEGIIDLENNHHDYNLVITDFRNNLFLLKKQNLNIQYQGSNLQIRKIKDRSPLDITFNYNKENNTYNIASKFENYTPGKYFVIIDDDFNNRFLIPAYTGFLNITYSPDDINSKISYNGNITTSLDKSILPYENRVSAVFAGNEQKISFNALSAETSRGSINFKGLISLDSMLPEGELSFRDIKYSGNGILNCEADFQLTGIDLTEAKIDLSYGNKKIKNAELRISRAHRDYDFRLNGGTGDSGSFSIIGMFSEFRRSLESEIELTDISSDYFMEFLSPALFADNTHGSDRYHINTLLRISTDFRHYTVRSENFRIYDYSDDKKYISASLFADNNDIVVSDVFLNTLNYKGLGRVSINRHQRNDYTLESELIVNNQQYLLNGTIYPGAGVIINGNYGLYLSFFSHEGKTNFSVFSENLPLPVKKMLPEASFRISGFIKLPGEIRAIIRNNTVRGIKTPNSQASASLSCLIDNNNLRFSRIVYKDDFSTITGSGDFFIRSMEMFYGWFSFASDKNEKYLLHLVKEKEGINANLNLYNSPVERFSGKNLSGKVSGNFEYSTRNGKTIYQVNGSLDEGYLLEDRVSADIDIKAEQDRITVNNINLAYNLNRLENLTGYLDYSSNNYFIESGLYLQKSPGSNILQSSLQISGNLSGDVSKRQNLTMMKFSDFADGEIILSNNGQDILGHEKWVLSFINTGNFLTVSGGPENSISAYMSGNGEFDLNISNPLPVTGHFYGIINNSKIDAVFDNIKLELETAGKAINNPYFRPNAGIAAGKLSISGSLNDPDFNGDLSATYVYADSLVTPDVIGPFNTNIKFEGKQIVIPETSIFVQKSVVFMRFDFIIDHWLPREFEARIRTAPGSRLWIKNTFAAVDVDGYASGEITISGDSQATEVSGKVIASRCIITLTDRKESKKKPAAKKEFIADLEIFSGSGVEFYWPSVRVPVLRTYASVGQKINIYTNSRTDAFSMDGDVEILGGEIFYFSQNFFLKEGKISFNENQDKFDPHITARAEIRERTADNREVRISMILEDNPLSSFSPRFESIPPLAENDIYSLLGEGIYSQFGGENITFGSALLGAGSYSSQLIGLLRPFETGVKKMLNLDLFSIRTEFLQKAFFTDLMPGGEVVYPAESGLNTYLDNTSVMMGKYYGEYFFLQGLFRFNSLDFDTYQYSYYDVPDFMGMYIETEISLEVDTPLFLLDITLYPRIDDFNKSLLDTTLQLSWRFSY